MCRLLEFRRLFNVRKYMHKNVKVVVILAVESFGEKRCISLFQRYSKASWMVLLLMFLLGLACAAFFVQMGNASIALAEEITAVSISNAAVDIERTEYTYSGNEIRPAVKSVTLAGKKLKENQDYTVAYLANKDAGLGIVRIHGINSYTNDVNKEFTINKRAVTVTARSATKTYDGSALFASEVGYDVSGLVKSSDLTKVILSGSQSGVGSSEAVVATCIFASGMSKNYELTKVNGTLTVKAAPITGVELSQTSFDYNGKEQRPTLTVRWAGGVVPLSACNIIWPDDTTNPGVKTVHVGAGGNFTGSMSVSYTIVGDTEPADGSDDGTVTGISMHRLYNPNSGEHFYTADDDERDRLVAYGWNSEGEGWTAPEMSSTPVYRLYNSVAGEHHYTMDAAERDMLIQAGWNDEGTGWYSDDAQTAALYRDYNPNAFANNHNYTTNQDEHDYLVSIGWQNEGLAWYGM